MFFINTYSKGIITESTNALVRYAFEQLKAVRIEIKCDEENTASRKIAEKLNFKHEGTLINNALKAHCNTLRNTVIYSRNNLVDLPELKVGW